MPLAISMLAQVLLAPQGKGINSTMMIKNIKAAERMD
jgi:hypothetical protein